MTSKLATESSPLVGSSRNRILGHVMSWLATLTRRFSPPDSPFRIAVPIMVSADRSRPNEVNNPSTRRSLSAFVTEFGRPSLAANSSVSLAVRLPIKLSSCSTKQLARRKVVFDASARSIKIWPSTENFAAKGRCASTLSSVLFPEPESPMMAMRSPVNCQSLVQMQPEFGVLPCIWRLLAQLTCGSSPID
jgi:hypothetical protein